MGRLAEVATAFATAAGRRLPGLAASDNARLAGAVTILQGDYPAEATDLHEARYEPLLDFFELDTVDTRLLTVAAAVDMDANFGLAAMLLAGETSPGWMSVGLAMELAGLGTLDPAARLRFSPRSPLLRYRLLDVVGEGPLLGRRLRVADRIVGHLLGSNEPDSRCAALEVGTVPYFPPVAASLAENIRSGAPLAYVQAAPGTAGLALAAGAFDHLGITPLIIDLTRRRAGDDLAGTVTIVGREAGLTGRGLVLGGADAVAADPSLWELVADTPVPTIAVGSRRWDAGWLRWLPFALVAPRPHPAQRQDIWRRSMAAVLPPDAERPADLRDLAPLTLDPEDAHRVVAATAAAAHATGGSVTVAGLRESARRLGRVSTETGVQRRQPRATFEDLVLPDQTLSGLKELVGWALHRDEVLAQGSVTGKGSKGRGILALFGGSPGTGKTLAAQVVASSLGLDLLTVELSAMVDKYIGETEKNLERVFQQAENMNCVLFFDEADALFGSRSEVRDAKDRYANQEVAYLLQRLEMFDGIALLATNLRGNLDPAFSRRLHFVIAFPDPDERTRVLLWRAHLHDLPTIDPTDPIDPELLGRSYELTGGEIRNVVMAAAYSAATGREPVGGRHIRRGVEREYAKLARLLPDHAPPSPPITAQPGNRTDIESVPFGTPDRSRRRAAVTITSRFPSTAAEPGAGTQPGGRP